MSTPLEDSIPLLLELASDIRDGRIYDAIAVSKRLAGIAVDLIPVDALKDSLSEEDKKWIDFSVDIAEAIKLANIDSEKEGLA